MQGVSESVPLPSPAVHTDLAPCTLTLLPLSTLTSLQRVAEDVVLAVGGRRAVPPLVAELPLALLESLSGTVRHRRDGVRVTLAHLPTHKSPHMHTDGVPREGRGSQPRGIADTDTGAV